MAGRRAVQRRVSGARNWVDGFKDDERRLWKEGRAHEVIIDVGQVGDELTISAAELKLDGETRIARPLLVTPETFTTLTKSGGGPVGSHGDVLAPSVE